MSMKVHKVIGSKWVRELTCSWLLGTDELLLCSLGSSVFSSVCLRVVFVAEQFLPDFIPIMIFPPGGPSTIPGGIIFIGMLALPADGLKCVCLMRRISAPSTRKYRIYKVDKLSDLQTGRQQELSGHLFKLFSKS
jgi:hypothetical protein